MHPLEKRLGRTEDGEGRVDECPHGISAHTSGAVYHDDEFPHPLLLAVLEGLDQRHIPVYLHAEGIEDAVEFVIRKAHHLSQGGEPAQERFVVLALLGCPSQILDETGHLIAPTGAHGLEVDG